jgi:hypothetical protein
MSNFWRLELHIARALEGVPYTEKVNYSIYPCQHNGYCTRGDQLNERRKRQFKRRLKQQSCTNKNKIFLPQLTTSYFCTSTHVSLTLVMSLLSLADHLKLHAMSASCAHNHLNVILKTTSGSRTSDISKRSCGQG